MTKADKDSQAFTLIEVLLSLAIIGVISVMAIPVLQSFQNLNDLNVATSSLAQTYRRAEILSQAMAGDSSWGVIVTSSSIILYQGSSYASRTPAFDEVFNISSSINVSGIPEVDFAKFTGLPGTSSAQILLDLNHQTSTISVNSKGMVAY